MKNVHHLLTLKLIGTLTTTIIMILIYAIISLVIAKIYKSPKQKKRVRARFFYLVLLVYFASIARLWIEGFGNIFTVLGLVSAALVVTNKETIMNFVGWFIVSWRGLFAEGDYVEINKLKGYVYQIGPLYFTLSNQKSRATKHACLTKIPNGLVINNPLVNYSQTDALYQKTITVTFAKTAKYKQELDACEQLLVTTIKNETKRYYLEFGSNIGNEVDESELLSSLKRSIKINASNANDIICTWEFECFFDHHLAIENSFWEAWIAALTIAESTKSCENVV